MAKINQFKLNLKASPSRTVFDRSYRINATAPLGLLRPIFCKEVIAGTKVQLGFENVTRMTGLKAPSFGRIREHMDYFFVPFTQLWRQYEQFRTQQSHYNSALQSNSFSGLIPPKVPTVQLYTLLSYLCGRDNQQSTSSLVEYSTMHSVFDCVGIHSIPNRLMLLEYLRYGGFGCSNRSELEFICGITDDGFTPDSEWQTLMSRHIPDKQVNLFRLLAFQKCYYDYYRNEKYEQNKLGAYNIDDCTTGVHEGTISFDNIGKTIIEATEPHYRWRKKDYFMSVTPDLLPLNTFIGFEGFALSSTSNLMGVAYADGTSILSYNNNSSQPKPSPSTHGYGVMNHSSQSMPNSGSTVVTGQDSSDPSQTQFEQRNYSASALKLLFARDKLLKRMYMAKNNYSAQMLAMFGFAPSTMRTDSVYHLGGCCNRIIVDDQPIYNGDTNIGAFAGKVRQYSNNQKCAEYEAKEDGIIMGIYSTSLENDYATNGIDRNNMRYTFEDFPLQQYQDLGRMPIFASEFGNFQRPSTVTTAVKDEVIGFVERYLDYKTSVDEVHYPFVDGLFNQGLEDFKRFATPCNNFTLSGSGSQQRISKPNQLYLQTMLVNPNQIADLVGYEYDGFVSTDCFIINAYNHFKAITPLKEKEF